MVRMVMLSVLTFMTIMVILIMILMMILTMILLMMILTMILMMILMMVGARTCILSKFPAAVPGSLVLVVLGPQSLVLVPWSFVLGPRFSVPPPPEGTPPPATPPPPREREGALQGGRTPHHDATTRARSESAKTEREIEAKARTKSESEPPLSDADRSVDFLFKTISC